MFDEDYMDDDGGNQNRLPCMPSLVALQQMKNRLNLAFLGKKLMKWTTLATAKELRKLAAEMIVYFKDYGTAFSTAFMLIARCRYYYPHLNTVVLENVSREAGVLVTFNFKSIAGVKLPEVVLTEKEPFHPYEHLGIGTGGITINDTKQAWRDLLRLVILMLQEKESFEIVHNAHKAANKKQNVLGKLIIPRIQNAIAYIKSELEEQEREETFRLKRFKQSKEKKTRSLKALEAKALEEDLSAQAQELTPTVVPPRAPPPPVVKPYAPPPPIAVQPSAPPPPPIAAQPSAPPPPIAVQPRAPAPPIAVQPRAPAPPIAVQPRAPEPPIAVQPRAPPPTAVQPSPTPPTVVQPYAPPPTEVKPYAPVPTVVKTSMPTPPAMKLPAPKPPESIPCIPCAAPCKQSTTFIQVQEPNIITKKQNMFCSCADPLPELDESSGKFICPICKLAEQNIEINVVPCKLCLPEVNEAKERADHLIAHINQVLTLSRLYTKTSSCLANNTSNLDYAKVKQELENINNVCACPHIEKDPCVCVEEKLLIRRQPCDYERSAPEAKFEEKFSDYNCCGCCTYDESKDKTKMEDNGNSAVTRYPAGQVLDTCEEAISATKSDEPSGGAEPHFQSSCNLCEAAPPFFYLYSGPCIRSQNDIQPICNTNKKSRSDTMSRKCVCFEAKNSCKRLVELCDCTDLPSQQSNEQCSCFSEKQATILSLTNCPNNSAKPTSKTSDRCVKKTSFKEIDCKKDTRTEKSPSNRSVAECPCGSMQPKTSHFCNVCLISATKTSATNAPFRPQQVRKSTTYFADVTPRFMPLLWFGLKQKTGSCNLTNVHTLSDTPIASDSANLYSTFNLNAEKEHHDTYGISNASYIAGVLNKFTLKQIMSFPPYTRKRKPDPCFIRSPQLRNSSLSNHFIIFKPCKVEENPEYYGIFNEKCISVSFNNIARTKSTFLLPQDGPRIYSIAPINLLEKPDSQSSIYITTQCNSSSTAKQNKVSPSVIFETSNASPLDSPLFKDCSTYVTVVPRSKAPYVHKDKQCDFSELMLKTIYFEENTCQDPQIPNGMHTQNILSCYNVSSFINRSCITTDCLFTAPFTREGKPGPSGLTVKKNYSQCARDEKSVDTIAQSSVATQSGCCDISEKSRNSKLTSYTREGVPGPFRFGATKSSASLRNFKYPCQSSNSRPVPYTREGMAGPCGPSKPIDTASAATSMSIINHKENLSAKPSTNFSCLSNGGQHSAPCSVSMKNDNTFTPCAMNPNESSTFKSSTREWASNVGSIKDASVTKVTVSSPNEVAPPQLPTGEKMPPKNYQGQSTAPPVPSTRESRPGSRNVSETNCSTSLQVNISIKKSISIASNVRQQSEPCSESKKNASDTALKSYTREGKPGVGAEREVAPCTVISYTREGQPGNYYISQSSNVVGSLGRVTSTHSTNTAAYTREGRPSNITTAKNNNYQGQFTDPAPSTRDCRVKSHNISDTNYTASFQGNDNVKKSIAIASNAQDSKPCSEYMKNGKVCSPCECNRKNATLKSYTREGRPGVHAETKVSSLNNVVSQQSPCADASYTREGLPANRWLSRTSNVTGSLSRVISTQFTNPAAYTREGRPGGPCNFVAAKNNNCQEQFTNPVSPARVSRAGSNCSACLQGNIIKKSVSITPKVPQHSEPCGVSMKNDKTCSPCAINPKDSTTLASYTKEGSPVVGGVSKKNPIPCTLNNAAFKGITMLRATSETKNSVNALNNVVPPQPTCTVASFTHEGKPGETSGNGMPQKSNDSGQSTDPVPCRSQSKTGSRNVSDTNCSASSGANKTNKSVSIASDVDQHSESCSKYVKSKQVCPPCAFNPKDTPLKSYTREGRPGVHAETKSSLNNVASQQPPCADASYTREGMPGKRQLSRVNNFVGSASGMSSTQSKNLAAYTREGRPGGPCDVPTPQKICRSGESTDPALSKRESKDGSRNVSDTTNLQTNINKSETCSQVTKNAKVCPLCVFNPTDTTLKSNTREGRSGVPAEKEAIVSSSQQPPSVVASYTREGMPGSRELSRTNNVVGGVSTPQSTNQEGYTRESRPGSRNASDTNNTTNLKPDINKSINIAPNVNQRSKTTETMKNDKDCSSCPFIPKATTLKSYTREGSPGGGGGVFKRKPIPSSPNSGAALKEGPGLGGASETKFTYTREGMPGPCGLFKANKPSNSLGYEDTKQPTYPTAYTREGRPGPCSTTTLHNDVNTGQSQKPASKTLECGTVSSNISSTNNIPCSKCKKDTKNSNTQEHSESCNVCLVNNNICPLCALDRSESINFKSYKRDGTPGLCGVSKKYPIPSSLDNTVLKEYIHDKPYSREKDPGQRSGSDINFTVSSVNKTASQQSPSYPSYTREGMPGPCGLFTANSVLSSIGYIDPKQSTNVEDPTCKGQPRPSESASQQSGIYPSSLGYVGSRQPSSTAPYTREERSGTCCPSKINNTASLLSEINNKTVSLQTLNKNHETCRLCMKKQIICALSPKQSWKSINSINYTNIPRTCIVSESNSTENKKTRSLCNLALKKSTYSTLNTPDGMQGLGGVSDTKDIANFRTQSDCRKSIKIESARESTESRGENKPRSCREPERNDTACPLHNIHSLQSSNLAPYTREEISSPCNISSSMEKEPYTREGRAGPCGPARQTYASYTCQHKTGPIFESVNTMGSSKLTPIPQLRSIATKSQQKQWRPGEVTEICEILPCLMCQVFTPPSPHLRNVTQHSLNRATKDATTYVNAIPRPKLNNFIFCGTCNGKRSSACDKSTKNCEARSSEIRINATRSLDTARTMECSTCRPNLSTSAAAGSLILMPLSKLLMPLSTPSRTCCCKSSIPSTSTLRSDPTCNKSEVSIRSKKYCSICGRPASKVNLETISAPVLNPEKYENYDKSQIVAPSYVPIRKPCSGCGKTKLLLSCSSNPSVKSIAIGTCTSYCASRKAALHLLPRCSTETTHCEKKKNGKKILGNSPCRVCNKIKGMPAFQKGSSKVTTKDSCSSFITDEANFGYFQVEFKKVTKIYRHKNTDGTIVDEKQVITTKTKKNCHEKLEDAALDAETIISSSLENDTSRTMNENCKFKSCRESKSVVIKGTVDPMASPKIRYCISVQDCEKMRELITDNFLGLEHFSNIAAAHPIISVYTSGLQTTTGFKDQVCANRLEETDSGPKCNCVDKSSKSATPMCANRLQDSDSGPKCDCAAKSPAKPATPACENRLQDSDSGPKCDCVDKSSPKATTPACANRLQDSDSGPKCDCASKSPSKPTTAVCTNRLHDSDSGPKCDCASKSPPKPTTAVCTNRLQDSDSGPKCDCASKSPSTPTTAVCTNRLQDSDSGPKCDCADKPSPIPTTPGANRLQDSGTRPNKPATEDSVNKLQNSDSGPKCDCTSKPPPKTVISMSACYENQFPPVIIIPKASTYSMNNSFPKPINAVSTYCANKLPPELIIPKPSTCSVNKSLAKPITPISTYCANKSPPKPSTPVRNCASNSPPKPATPTCANRLQDSDSGPKCDCTSEVPSKPVISISTCCENNVPFKSIIPKPTYSAHKSPLTQITPVRPIMPQYTDSGTNSSHVSTFALAAPTGSKYDRLQDTNSGTKCSCSTNALDASTGPVCANRLQDTNSGSKCDCSGQSLPTPVIPMSTCCESSFSPMLIIPQPSTHSVDKPPHKPSTPMCNCANKFPPKLIIPKPIYCMKKSPPVQIAPVRPIMQQYTDNRPNSSNVNIIALVASTGHPVCPNRLQDGDSGPKHDQTAVSGSRLQDPGSEKKCSCYNTAPPAASNGPVCGNRLQDSDSGTKCDCANKSPPKPTTPICANRLEDTDSGKKCTCYTITPAPSSGPVCGNRLQDSDSGTKCDCANKSPPKPTTPICANRLEDTDSGKKCTCYTITPAKSTGPVCGNRLQDSDSGTKCDCANKAPKLTTPVCANRLQDSDSGPKCDCASKSSPKPTTAVCGNRLEDSGSGPKCDCASKSPKPTTSEYPNAEKNSRGYVYIVVSKKSLACKPDSSQKSMCYRVLTTDVACSNIDQVFGKPKAANKSTSPTNLIEAYCPLNAFPKAYKNSYCSTTHESKLSNLQSRFNMLDALRQLFQPSNSRTRNRKALDKNLGRASRYPLTNNNYFECRNTSPLRITCNEKFNDEDNQNPPITGCNIELESPISRRSTDQMSFSSKNSSVVNAEANQRFPAVVSNVIIGTDNNFSCVSFENHCATRVYSADAGTSPEVREEKAILIKRKGNIKHASLRDTKDFASHSRK